MSELSIQQAGPVQEGVDLDAYYRTTPREAVKKEAKAIMRTQGVYVPKRWVKRWDLMTAAYLAHFVSYVGTQKDEEGWIWKSYSEVEEETGLTRSQQNRSRGLLRDAGVIEVKTGGIGNKVHVQVNIELLKLMDDLPSVEEVEQTQEQDAPAPQRATTAAPESATLAPQPAALAHQRATHNNNTRNTAETSLSASTHARPEPDTERREEKSSEKIERCVTVLSGIEDMRADPRMLTRLVETLAEKYPTVAPVDACKTYRDKVAAMSERVRSHRAYLEGHFEREAERIANEPVNPYSPAGMAARDKPRRADWYATFHGGSVEQFERMIRGGLTHTEIMEALDRRAA